MANANNGAPVLNGKSSYVLAIDLGSGGIKVALVSVDGKIITSSGEQITTFLMPDGGAEQDAGQWWDCVKNNQKSHRRFRRFSG